MRTASWVLATIAFVGITFLIFPTSFTNINPPVTSASAGISEAQYGWREELRDTISISPGNMRSWNLRVPGEWKFKLHSNAPVTMGLVISEARDRAATKLSEEEIGHALHTMSCLSEDVLEVFIPCKVPTGVKYALIVRDRRTVGDVLNGLLISGWTRDARAIERQDRAHHSHHYAFPLDLHKALLLS